MLTQKFHLFLLIQLGSKFLLDRAYIYHLPFLRMFQLASFICSFQKIHDIYRDNKTTQATFIHYVGARAVRNCLHQWHHFMTIP